MTEFQELFFGAGSGIPQGGVLSPMLANFYLLRIRSSNVEPGFNLVRYADDFVVMCGTEGASPARPSVQRGHIRTLNLRIHPLDAPGF